MISDKRPLTPPPSKDKTHFVVRVPTRKSQTMKTSRKYLPVSVALEFAAICNSIRSDKCTIGNVPIIIKYFVLSNQILSCVISQCNVQRVRFHHSNHPNR